MLARALALTSTYTHIYTDTHARAPHLTVPCAGLCLNGTGSTREPSGSAPAALLGSAVAAPAPAAPEGWAHKGEWTAAFAQRGRTKERGCSCPCCSCGVSAQRGRSKGDAQKKGGFSLAERVSAQQQRRRQFNMCSAPGTLTPSMCYGNLQDSLQARVRAHAGARAHAHTHT